jgi:hypothetical protein
VCHVSCLHARGGFLCAGFLCSLRSSSFVKFKGIAVMGDATGEVARDVIGEEGGEAE